VHKTYINSILKIIFKVFIVIESGFTFTVIRVDQFSPVQVDAIAYHIKKQIYCSVFPFA
jgi:hypothetical protein